MSIPMTFKGVNYMLTDSKTLNQYPHFFVNFVFIQNNLYKKYILVGSKQNVLIAC